MKVHRIKNLWVIRNTTPTVSQKYLYNIVTYTQCSAHSFQIICIYTPLNSIYCSEDVYTFTENSNAISHKLLWHIASSIITIFTVVIFKRQTNIFCVNIIIVISFSHLSRRHHIISLTFESCWKHTILIIKCMTAATITTENFKFTVIKTCISMRVFHVDRLMQCVRFSSDIFSCFSHLRSFFSVLLYLMLCKFFSFIRCEGKKGFAMIFTKLSFNSCGDCS